MGCDLLLPSKAEEMDEYGVTWLITSTAFNVVVAKLWAGLGNESADRTKA
jgi:hypothetical protein